MKPKRQRVEKHRYDALQKELRSTYIAFTAFVLLAVVSVHLALDKPAQVVIDTSASELRAKTQLAEAQRTLRLAEAIQTERDTVYLERVEIQEKWRIKVERSGNAIPVRLDSCIQVGTIVLKELQLCNDESELYKSAAIQAQSAFLSLDTALTQSKRAERKQRNRKALWRSVSAALAVVVVVVAV